MNDRFTLHTAPLLQAELADSQREDFLRALDEAALDGVNVTEFEAKFIGDFLAAPSRWIWTGPRRHVVEEMLHKYRLPARSTDGSAGNANVRQLPPATAGKCSYLVRVDAGPQQRCNQPAPHRTNLGAEFCPAHWQQRNEWLERKRQINKRRP